MSEAGGEMSRHREFCYWCVMSGFLGLAFAYCDILVEEEAGAGADKYTCVHVCVLSGRGCNHRWVLSHAQS